MTPHNQHLSDHPPSWDILFWDLDGTITDPKLGIIGSYQQVLREYGIEPPKESDLLWVIGPALRECLAKLLPIKTSQEIEQAVTRYRHWYVEEGLMYQDTPYDQIRELLVELSETGKPLFIATAKAHSYARKILQHYKLDGFFKEVYGSELDGTRANKVELLSWLMEQEKITPSRGVVMIGDRHHDVKAGIANGLTTVGVGYGYGSETELREAGVHHYCPTMKELIELLIGVK